MDSTFHPAVLAIKTGDATKFIELVRNDPSLATTRSTKSHPTLLQCLVLDGKDQPRQIEMLNVLIDAGASMAGPLVAAAGINNVEAVNAMLDRGAPVDGAGGWSPLEEALYWNSQDTINALLSHGARASNLRIAAGLGRTDDIERFFNTDGSLKPEAGKIDWPFGTLEMIERSNFDRKGKDMLSARIRSWSQDRQGIVDNAFVYACSLGQIPAATLLLDKGANINAIPGGFDFSGTGLHYAALHGQFPMVQFLLEHGANPRILDTKVGTSPASWAKHGGHANIAQFLESFG